MRNLLIFITKYNAFFLFLIFEVGALVIYGKYNSFQKASLINSTNEVTGNVYAKYNEAERYLSLQQVNDQLAKDNAALRAKLKSSFYIDTLAKRMVNDTVYLQQYEYTVARVINNSVNKRNNTITINRGSDAGIQKNMGVISDQGVVGIVVMVSKHFSIVMSLLHKETSFSAMLNDDRVRGTIKWADNLDPRVAQLVDVNNSAKPHIGELVVASDQSLFPTGVPIGRVSNLRTKTGGFFLNMEVTLSVDFSKLQYVYVVTNRLNKEQTDLELKQKDEQNDIN
ncbi:rod shape-determining protein MreC [Mucilaginibacter myungsuensis]|uniref:Cell shape-determining protein MreC n=1 Tax=Mucilaginibacter myungsuensis TaxID=649104 RepID=A0A929KXI7_9SPHI|nr:rod shape-determining protein MreC [Mucilaginibacter myungsuensis]MBE9663474.1 rod shape-determining protein MreC [Mucilaginibacter myungsuensis]MDN3600212.1 rod shape-determining protein MreC [Mucilaginibacter myungsuensis]